MTDHIVIDPSTGRLELLAIDDGAPEFDPDDDLTIAEEDEPDWDCVEHMGGVDRAPPEVRLLIYEYGLIIVFKTIADVCQNAAAVTNQELKLVEMALKSWRFQRQQQWLTTDFITAKVGMSMVDVAYIRKRAAGLV